MKIHPTMQEHRKISGLAAIAIAAGALAACSGGSTPSSDANATATAPSADSAPDNGTDPAASNKTFHDSAVATGIITARKACDLLTRADAEIAVGQSLPKNTSNITLGTCDYTTDDFSAGASLTVGSWESIKGAATAGEHQSQAISGIGDEALYFAGSETGGSPLYVRKGDEGFLLDLNGPKIDHMASADAVVVEKDLALKVIAKF
jgi:hypothetical protein